LPLTVCASHFCDSSDIPLTLQLNVTTVGTVMLTLAVLKSVFVYCISNEVLVEKEIHTHTSKFVCPHLCCFLQLLQGTL